MTGRADLTSVLVVAVLSLATRREASDVYGRAGGYEFAPPTAMSGFSVGPNLLAADALDSCCAAKGSYEAAVRAFAHGDRTAASALIAGAPMPQVQRAIARLDVRDPQLLEAAATMHLALAARALKAEDYDTSAAQLKRSDEVFQKILVPGEDPSFVGDWYIAVVSAQMNRGDFGTARTIALRGVHASVAPAPTLFAEGLVEESAAYLDSRMSDDRQSKEPSKRTIALKTAEDQYRLALQADPASREVRLHLGRVLAVERKDGAARAALETLLTESDQRSAYLAHLFLAELAARRHDNDTARREYSAAISVNPSSDSPYIGLSNLALLADDEPGARESVSRWTTRQSGAPDPWIAYRTGLDQIDPALERLLERIGR